MRGTAVGALAILGVLIGLPTFADAGMVNVANPGFETGGLTGWTATGSENGAVAYSGISNFSGWGDDFAKVGYGEAGEITQTMDGNGNDEVVIAADREYIMTVQQGRIAITAHANNTKKKFSSNPAHAGRMFAGG